MLARIAPNLGMPNTRLALFKSYVMQGAISYRGSIHVGYEGAIKACGAIPRFAFSFHRGSQKLSIV